MFAKNNISKSIILLISFLVIITSCNKSKNTLFKQLPASKTNIHFSNDITETEDFNILNFHYIYNGGGVGVGDFNKDGFQDLVFTGNQVASKLYLNKQNLTFEDITQKSNFKSKGWATGVSIIDINADGWEDIYISVGGFQCDGNCHNQLFIHQGLDENGVPTFVEMAAEYGLDDGLYTQQAAFFDYDLDGDLDVYLLHNVIDKRDKNVPSEKRFINENSIDYLLENNGNGKFINKSNTLGITERGYGLGITINDFNDDNLPDIYVANDFLSDDLLYINNGFVQEDKSQHLGFSEVSKSKLKHTSYNAMGVDVADVNGDALPDIFVLDMLPEYNERQKTMLGFMNYNKYLLALRQGYSPQYIRNTLQLHNGFLNGEMLPFSEVGYMSGVYKTDWSWTPLLADFDNDGDRDLFVTNGYGKDITDLDFINYSAQRSPFGTKEAQEKELYESVKAMKSISMPNYIFENTSESNDIPNFKNQQNNWIKKENSISNGAVYADLDNDGDLDLIVNNIDEKAFVMENTTSQKSNNNYLKIQLKGTQKNPSAIGTKVQIWTNGSVQSFYQSPVRGYLSSVENIAHFGIGKHQTIDSLKLVWYNGQEQVLKNVTANQLLEVSISDAKNSIVQIQNLSPVIFSKMTDFQFQHQENYHLDFDAQPLLLHQHSRQGPCLASANIDGEVGEELFVGGAKGFPSQIFTQQSNGKYKVIATLDAEYEDTDAAFFDADNDGDLDLYVVSGGTEFQANAAKYQDRIYLNDGKGNLTKSTINNLPNNSGSCVVSMDFDKDGDIDLFIGGRVSPQNYPKIPQSYLLENQNGQFKDITPKALKNVGMVTDAIWSDYDKNGWQDLIIVGEFMPITIFKNKGGKIPNSTFLIPNSAGMWNCIAVTDFDNDGDDDYILGNLGENARFQASANEPLAIYNKDFDKNGSFDPLVGQYFLNKKGKKDFYPIHTRDDVMKQIVVVKNRYVKYAEFGKVTLSELLKTDLKSGDFLKANELKSSYLENLGKGNFDIKSLPKSAQIAPINNILIDDFNNDNHADILLSGNDYNAERNNGRFDAFNGLLLTGNGKGDFENIPTSKSGFYVPFDGRDILKVNNQIVVGQNDGEILMFGY